MTNKNEKRRDALTIFTESVHKPDHKLRACAHNQGCFDELMEWRDEVLQYLQTRHQQEFGSGHSYTPPNYPSRY
tara:strand:- start:1988 stop:2209 length:222 start_codon:yes stop_codon:yes gene_type:complete